MHANQVIPVLVQELQLGVVAGSLATVVRHLVLRSAATAASEVSAIPMLEVSDRRTGFGRQWLHRTRTGRCRPPEQPPTDQYW
ncbi:hypothetical protein ACFU6I_39460 [Streptomyces sp. NPDC057486]|uniref:hypothetical protein n=1 Tax=Streptomyces sp. NPDC057486 TaxID=3346145 RepID=UPI00367DB442